MKGRMNGTGSYIDLLREERFRSSPNYQLRKGKWFKLRLAVSRGLFRVIRFIMEYK